MDEFSTLVGGVSEDLPPDYSGSLEYIDELPVAGEEAWRVLRDLPVRSLDPGRDAAVIANASANGSSDLFDALPQDELALAHDNRRFQFDINYDPGEYVRGSSRLKAEPFRLPLDPERDPREVERSIERGLRRMTRPGPFSMLNKSYAERVYFTESDRVRICAERKRRREILASKGLLGRFYRPRHGNVYSKVHCE